jgi:hypothetical protein
LSRRAESTGITHTGGLGVGDQILHAAVVGRIDENFFHRRRLVTQTRGHSVETENHFVLHHLSLLLTF